MSFIESDSSLNDSTSDSNDKLVDADKEKVVNSNTNYNVKLSQNFTRLVNTCWMTTVVFVMLNLI